MLASDVTCIRTLPLPEFCRGLLPARVLPFRAMPTAEASPKVECAALHKRFSSAQNAYLNSDAHPERMPRAKHLTAEIVATNHRLSALSEPIQKSAHLIESNHYQTPYSSGTCALFCRTPFILSTLTKSHPGSVGTQLGYAPEEIPEISPRASINPS